jgi:lipoprotein NlpI
MMKFVRVGILLLLVGLVAGCNIFESFAPSESADDYVADGREALRDGDYAAAIDAFNSALEDDPGDARAHWGLAKAYIRQSGYTSIDIMTKISTFEQNGNLPFMDDSPFEANRLYVAAQNANYHLRAIHDGMARSVELNRSEVALDYTGTLAVEGILLIRDTNGDGVIDASDIDLTAFYTTGQFNMDQDWDSMSAAEQQAVIDNVADVLTQSEEVLVGMIEDLGLEEQLGIDTDQLGDVISDLEYDISNYPITAP